MLFLWEHKKGFYVESIQCVRRRRLAQLQSELGSQTELIHVTGLAQSYVSGLIRGRNPFGEKAARKIEKLTGKPYLWLDDVDVASVRTEEIIRDIRSLLENVPPEMRDQVLRGVKDK